MTVQDLHADALANNSDPDEWDSDAAIDSENIFYEAVEAAGIDLDAEPFHSFSLNAIATERIDFAYRLWLDVRTLN